MSILMACKNCKLLTELEHCPVCKSPTTKHWSGYLGVIDPEKSEIGKKLGINIPGEYAVKT
ncbi:DNA-directed RNA polymerase subunit E'' [Candidatus Altiarchaeales archaeon WOR_SM1_SCG]|nr:DNA-directed RNA polymerase subunit E'' [Candidatus Altiarchaeales archaeon WOR_SM1_SCG]